MRKIRKEDVIVFRGLISKGGGGPLIVVNRMGRVDSYIIYREGWLCPYKEGESLSATEQKEFPWGFDIKTLESTNIIIKKDAIKDIIPAKEIGSLTKEEIYLLGEKRIGERICRKAFSLD